MSEALVEVLDPNPLGSDLGFSDPSGPMKTSRADPYAWCGVKVNVIGGRPLVASGQKATDRICDRADHHGGAEDHQRQTADHHGGADGTGGAEDHHGGADGTEDHQGGAETPGRDWDLGKTDRGREHKKSINVLPGDN